MPSEYNARLLAADYTGRAPEARRILNFFLRQKGRRGEFYVPSDTADVPLAAATGNAFLYVDGQEFAAAWADHPVNRAVAFKMRDGTRFYRQVVAITVQGEQSRVQLDQAVPYYLSPADVEVISWLPVMRLASDELIIEWLTTNAIRARLTYRTLKAAPAE